MSKFTKMLGASFVCVLSCAVISGAFAADLSRAGAVRANRTGQVARMPSMPVLPIDAMGNTTVDKENNTVTPQPQPEPEPEPEPQPKPECADGGVRNSEYTVADCMNEILSCINNGALAGGLNDLFNEDMRNAIVNGMGLCSVQVDKCMVSVRRDCKPVYRAMADVWVDFNSRKVQPEYYNFVLRKTGLTPNQAENTCLLLDRNTYGPSFSAVANDGTTTSEYNNTVGAYNGQMGNVLIKTNPMGAVVNEGQPGVDGQRGHYARWDATTATCYLRVAAYNKDKQIKNSWLFGALGNDELAEVWRPAGDTFSCNKDLFGFSLMNDTSTAAVVGIGGGTLLGAGIGALAAQKRPFDCGNSSALRKLNKELTDNSDTVATLNRYLAAEHAIMGGSIDKTQCEKIEDLYVNYLTIKDDLEKGCTGEGQLICGVPEGTEGVTGNDVASQCIAAGINDAAGCINFAKTTMDLDVSCVLGTVGCKFKSLKNPASLISGLKCDQVNATCASREVTEAELAELESAFAKLGILKGEKKTGASIATGAAIGAGAGGVATAITAFVEKNNINCRVGDGLNTVAFGKSHSIDTLKDFYVKWNLRLPDTVAPTSTAVDCKSWKLACAQYTDLNQCKAAAVNYKPDVNGTITLVHSACAVSGSVCIENAAVANSYGACE